MTLDDLLRIFGSLLLAGYGIAAVVVVVRIALAEIDEDLDRIRRGGF